MEFDVYLMAWVDTKQVLALSFDKEDRPVSLAFPYFWRPLTPD